MSKKPVLLLIDDEESLVETLSVLLKREGFEVVSALTGAEGVDRFNEAKPDIVLTDVRMPKMDGVEVLQSLRERDPHVPIVLMTAQASLQSAIQAVNLGATHYVQKPFVNEELLAILRRSLQWGEVVRENDGLKRELRKRSTDDVLKPHGVSPTFRRALELAERVAATESTILIRGESGTGKEVFARYIHELSDRSGGRFLSINCGALPEGLLESELFGHVKGSFTGAVKDKEGLFVAASGGSFFLDEVGEMAPATQVKLLRVLQQREVIPVGATDPQSVDVRLIAATNRDLERDIEQGRFRSDLYYRLNVISIELPALRERLDDIPLLADHFLERQAGGGQASAGESPRRRATDRVKTLSAETLAILQAYQWPGNVRELENVIERAVALSRGETIGVEALPPNVLRPPTAAPASRISSDGVDLDSLMASYEKGLLSEALEKAGGVKKRAAALLGISFRSFRYRLEKLRLEDPDDAD